VKWQHFVLSIKIAKHFKSNLVTLLLVAAWHSGNVVGLDQRSSPTLSPVSAGMGDRFRVRLPEAALYFGMLPTIQVDSTFYSP